MVDAGRVKAAAQAYIYGYPLVYDLKETAKLASGTSPLVEGATLNQFGYARQLLGPDAEFVSPNNDTLYVVAAVDVSAGPVVLHVPDTDDRYYVLQFVDAWSNNFAYIGRRATGTKEAQFLLTSTAYDGDIPHGMSVVAAPSNLFTIVGRVAVDGAQDVPAAQALQDQFTLTPVGTDQPDGMPVPDPGVPADLAWWESFRVALLAFPPPVADQEFVDAAAKFGLKDATSPFVDADPALAEVLVAGEAQAKTMLEELSRTSLKIVDGWSSAMHAFDYNLDRLGPGTIDSPEWKLADRTFAYVLRAVAARVGLWGNHGYEAQYDILWQDENGDELDGSHTYELTLSPPPPVDAFWSLTMYDEPEYYLVANPIDRFSIGDRTSGLQAAADGSVTILMQKDSPGPDREANWLPAPPGQFRPILRSYQPRPAILDGEYQLAKVRKTS